MPYGFGNSNSGSNIVKSVAGKTGDVTLVIADVNSLQTTLNSKISSPLTANLNANGREITNVSNITAGANSLVNFGTAASINTSNGHINCRSISFPFGYMESATLVIPNIYINKSFTVGQDSAIMGNDVLYISSNGDARFKSVQSNSYTLSSSSFADPSHGVYVPRLTSDPTTSNVAGKIYFNTTSRVLRIHDGTSWKTIQTV